MKDICRNIGRRGSVVNYSNDRPERMLVTSMILDTITILRFILNSKDILTSRNLHMIGKFAYDKFLSGDEK